MRLLYTLTAYPPSVGGAQIHTHLLAQYLQQEHRVCVVCHWDTNRTDWLLGTTLWQPKRKHYEIDGVAVQRLGLSFTQKAKLLPWLGLYYPWMAKALPAIAQPIVQEIEPSSNTVDLIHNIRIGREGISYASLQVARQHHIPFVFTPVHHPRWVGWRYQAYLSLYRQADAVIALTPTEKEILVNLGVLEEHIHVTGIGPVLAHEAEPQRFRETYAIHDDPIVLFLGQHYPYKGYRQVLEAAALVWAKIPEAHFVFMGPRVKGSEAIFKQYADFRLHRLGAVSLAIKTDALAACTVLCVPSQQESFGGVYTEAWAFGKPVIGGNIPAIADVISDGVDGYLVAQAPDEIADRIIYVLTHPAEAEALGMAGQAKLNAHYTWPQLAEKTAQIYRQVIG